MIQFQPHHWALILGGSSGFGLATAKKLARHGMGVFIIHRDRRGAMEGIERNFEEIRREGHGFEAVNLDALSEEGRKTALDALVKRMGGEGRVRVLLHSIAWGNLKPIAPVPPELRERYGQLLIGDEDMAQTIYSMGTSLLTWVQEIFKRRLFADDARVLGMTSEGNEIAWRGYAAVSAAKVALESVSRSIALEYAPYGIRSNIIQAGVTDTPALRLIPGSEEMKARSEARNPFRRLTRPEDVANFICLMCTEEAAWVNGTILRVDGGERIGS